MNLGINVTKVSSGSIFNFSSPDHQVYAQTVLDPRTKNPLVFITSMSVSCTATVRLGKEDALELFKAIIKELESPDAKT